jgi:HEPN domain-containing protein
MTTLKGRGDETPAEAFLTTAKQYHLAAITLLTIHQRVEAPLYFLFTHALELALKTYLRSRGLATPRGPQGHALRDLLEQCYRNGLQVGLDLRNVVQLLESENSRHGFRYFVFEGTGRPDIN